MIPGQPKGSVVVDERYCKGCERCVPACPKNLLVMNKKINERGYYPAVFDDHQGICTGCALCAIVCPDIAIMVYKNEERRAS